MSNETKIATIRGAGIAFAVASVWYAVTGNVSVFSLVLFGGGLGFLVGILPGKHPALQSVSSAAVSQSGTARARGTEWMKIFSHPNPVLRFGALMTLGVLLFLLAWYVGYLLLPEGLFRGGAQAHMARAQLTEQSVSVFEEWTKIYRANLVPAFIIILGSLLLRVNGISFGYLVALTNLMRYGLYIGTNSFAIPYPERMAPSFEILGRGGPYEMIALVMLASATWFWSVFEVRQLFRTNPERIRQRGPFSWTDAVGVGLGLVILAAANWIEALMVMAS
jgi:hypothetical protein